MTDILGPRPSYTSNKNGENSKKESKLLEELQMEVEGELVEEVMTWFLRIVIIPPGLAAAVSYMGGAQDLSQVANPALICLSGICASLLSQNTEAQVTITVVSLSIAIFRHAVFYQGCSACIVPALYGFLPCAVGFVFRTSRAVLWSTVYVLAITMLIFAIDISGNCPSEPLDAGTGMGTIIADRLAPLLALTLGNSAILMVILRESKESCALHAEATKSAMDLANMRQDVLHRVTHELRTPLNGLVGSVELLTVSETMSISDMENALTVQRCLNNIIAICDNVLIAAKEDHSTEEKDFVLASCIDDVAETYAATVHAKGLELRVEYNGDTTAVVHGMEVKLRQVLLNLVGNAVKFTRSGSITIRVCAQQVADTERLRCTFEVEDTGIGIETAYADLLFEPFHQGEQGGAVSRRHKGTGLGLTICKEFVERMGGKIFVGGARGKGSSFKFTICLKNGEQKNQSPSTADHAVCGKVNPSSQHFESCEFAIIDSKEESLESCRSIIKSIAGPSSEINTYDSPPAFLVRISAENHTKNAKIRRVVFLEYEPNDAADFASRISLIQEYGWLVLAYCSRGDFADATRKAPDVATYQRPLPLVRIGENLRDTVRGRPQAGKEVSSTEDVCKEFGVNASNNSFCMFDSVEATFSDEETDADTKEPTPDFAPHKPSTKVVVVDDTPLNVKLLSKMLRRLTSMPVLSFCDGQSIIDLVGASNPHDTLLVLLDWHMPGVCGLAATEAIRKITKLRGGPGVYLCMLTADIEGLRDEMNRRRILYEATVAGEQVIKKKEVRAAALSAIRSSNGFLGQQFEREEPGEEYTLLDLAAGKPVTFKSVRAILAWFKEQTQ